MGSQLSQEQIETIRKEVKEKYGDRFLKLPEVAEILGYSIKTAMRLASNDVFPVFRMHRRVRTDPCELFWWIEGLKKGQSVTGDGE